ncbi:unnamed protein product [Prorocentrum cordatum]|uniref:Uncharacterized protein n=1 Tax=Prorocentrum cordatum TaxID=2364126 RepID=A0ABN9RRQ9_9DINO|nr:unnamed protein product [Polarella glacialis]
MRQSETTYSRAQTAVALNCTLLVNGLKKIVDHEFGAGASDRIDRVVQMYERVGRNAIFEDEGPGGRRYAPGYISGLEPALPFHDTGAHPWCAHLERHWKAIWQELQSCNEDESLWTPGAYQASNEAYEDWKIMGVFTADQWQDERRFAVTTRVLKQLEGKQADEMARPGIVLDPLVREGGN